MMMMGRGLMMRAALGFAALAAAVISQTPAYAGAAQIHAVGQLECTWRGLPAAVRANVVRDVRSLADLSSMAERMAGLEDAQLVAAGAACGLDVDANPGPFGQYLFMRGATLALGSRLQIEYGIHDGQLDAVLSKTPAATKAAIAQFVTAAQPGDMNAAVAVVRETLQAEGVDTSNTDLMAIFTDYAVVRIAMDSLPR